MTNKYPNKGTTNTTPTVDTSAKKTTSKGGKKAKGAVTQATWAAGSQTHGSSTHTGPSSAHTGSGSSTHTTGSQWAAGTHTPGAHPASTHTATSTPKQQRPTTGY